MEFELGVNLLLQVVPAIAQIFTALQEEKVLHIKHKYAQELKSFSQPASRQAPEADKALERWPLKLLPGQILAKHNSQTEPLRVFLAPIKWRLEPDSSEARFFPAMVGEIGLKIGEFLRQHYPLTSSDRPVEFFSDIWPDAKDAAIITDRETSIKAIFACLKDIPTLILETEIIGDCWQLRIAYWGLGGIQTYTYQTLIAEASSREILDNSAKKRAQQWQTTAEKLLASGASTVEVKQLGGDNAINLEIWQQEQKWQSYGIHAAELDLAYKHNRKDFSELGQAIATCHCLTAAWVADAYHVVHSGSPSQLPELLPQLTAASEQSEGNAAINNLLLAMESCYLPPKSATAPSNSKKIIRSHHWLNEDSKRQHLSGIVPPLASTDKVLNLTAANFGNKIAEIAPKSNLETVVLAHTLTGHSGRSASIAASLDGKTLASGSEDNTIKLWNLATGELVRVLNAQAGRVLTIAMSPDGQTLASSHRTSERSLIKIWNLHSGELLHTLTGHKNWIYALAISPDGKTLISSGYKIKVWDLQTGELRHTLNGHKKWVYALAISPDGKTLASSGGDKIIKIWHLASGELRQTLAGHSDWVRSLAISPDGKTLASGSDDLTIKLWELNSGKHIRTLTEHGDWVLSLAISPDSQTLISGSKDNTIKLWNLATGKLLRSLTEHKKWVYSLAISPDGRTLASGSEDKTIKIWRAC